MELCRTKPIAIRCAKKILMSPVPTSFHDFILEKFLGGLSAKRKKEKKTIISTCILLINMVNFAVPYFGLEGNPDGYVTKLLGTPLTSPNRIQYICADRSEGIPSKRHILWSRDRYFPKSGALIGYGFQFCVRTGEQNDEVIGQFEIFRILQHFTNHI